MLDLYHRVLGDLTEDKKAEALGVLDRIYFNCTVSWRKLKHGVNLRL